MALGLSQKLNVLQQSPYDLHAAEEPAGPSSDAQHWVPSRYNVRAHTTDGRFVLWNTFSGKMAVFPARNAAALRSLLSKQGFKAKPRGVTKYLHDRGFLVKAGTDEFRRFQLAFGQQHYRTDRLELILLASEDCNFRCTYCYEDFARGTMQPAVRNGVKALVRQRLAGGVKALSISWFGGEPLYGWAAVEELAPFFLAETEAAGVQLECSMTTNGYLLTPDVAAKLLAWKIRHFQITIDGPPEVHDCSRPGRDGQGTFQTIFDNLRAMRQLPDEFRVDLRVNFDRDTHSELARLFDLLQVEFKGDQRFRMRFRAVGKWGGPNDQDLNVCGTDETNDIKARLKDEAERRGLTLGDDLRDIDGLGAQVCYAARPYNMIVGASGKLMKCTIDLDKQDRNVVGSLREDGSLDLDSDRLALWTEPAYENDKKCKKCVMLPTCQGIYCPLIRFDEHRSPCTPLRSTAKEEIRRTAEAYAGAPVQTV